MADRTKGITVVLGGDTTGLSKALSGVNKEISSTQKQLKDVEKLLKLDPTNTELLAQKERLLSEAIEETSGKLDTLKEAEKQVQQQFERGEVSQQQYEGLQREIAATEISLKRLKDSAQSADGEIGKINEKPIEEVADAADEAKSALSDAGNEASTFSDVLGAGALIEGAKSFADAISSIADETKEYRKIMGTLETSSDGAGYTADQTSEAFYQLYWALGDEQTASTALANLQALKLEQGDLLDMIDLVTGAWATYGDSIPIDGLAESVNETIRTGTVTGNFADVLNWGSKEGETFGVMLKDNTEANKEWNDAVADATTAEDFFNLALQDASSEQERANLVAQAMASQGLADTADAWYQNNKDIVNANDAQLRFMDSAAQLSEKISPVMTAVQSGFASVLDTLLSLSEGVNFDQIASTVGQFFTVLQNVITFLVENKDFVISALAGIAAGIVALNIQSFAGAIMSVVSGATSAAEAFPALSGAITALTNPVFLVTAAVVAFVAVIATSGDQIQAKLQELDDFLQGIFATDWSNVFGPVLGGVLNAFFQNLKNIWDSIKQVFDGVIDFIRGVFTGDWERAWTGVKEIFKGIFDGLVSIAKAPINGIIGLLNSAIGAINSLIRGINSIGFDMPDWLGGGSWHPRIPSIPTIPMLANGGTVLSGSAIVGEAGPELLTVGPAGTRVQPLTSSGSSTVAPVSAVTYPQILSAAQMIVSAIENSEIVIGDDVIGRANARYQADRAIVTGGAY